MKYTFVDINAELCDAWDKVFANVENVSVQHCSFTDLQCDALVSPANSYGFMNGGIDFAISKHLGWHIEKRLQAVIRDHFYGELLVGQATIVPTDQVQFPYLIAAPTMRTPMTIHRTPNVYHTMKALLLLANHGTFPDGTPVRDKVKHIALPGLGTGIGQMLPMDCARQMRIAWEDVQHQKHLTKEGWEEMCSNFAYFYTGNQRDLKYDIP